MSKCLCFCKDSSIVNKESELITKDKKVKTIKKINKINKIIDNTNDDNLRTSDTKENMLENGGTNSNDLKIQKNLNDSNANQISECINEDYHSSLCDNLENVENAENEFNIEQLNNNKVDIKSLYHEQISRNNDANYSNDSINNDDYIEVNESILNIIKKKTGFNLDELNNNSQISNKEKNSNEEKFEKIQILDKNCITEILGEIKNMKKRKINPENENNIKHELHHNANHKSENRGDNENNKINKNDILEDKKIINESFNKKVRGDSNLKNNSILEKKTLNQSDDFTFNYKDDINNKNNLKNQIDKKNINNKIMNIKDSKKNNFDKFSVSEKEKIVFKEEVKSKKDNRVIKKNAKKSNKKDTNKRKNERYDSCSSSEYSKNNSKHCSTSNIKEDKKSKNNNRKMKNLIMNMNLVDSKASQYNHNNHLLNSPFSLLNSANNLGFPYSFNPNYINTPYSVSDFNSLKNQGYNVFHKTNFNVNSPYNNQLYTSSYPYNGLTNGYFNSHLQADINELNHLNQLNQRNLKMDNLKDLNNVNIKGVKSDFFKFDCDEKGFFIKLNFSLLIEAILSKTIKVEKHSAGCEKCKSIYRFICSEKLEEVRLFNCDYCNHYINPKSIVYYSYLYLTKLSRV